MAIGVFAMSNQVRGWYFRMRIHHPIWGPQPLTVLLHHRHNYAIYAMRLR